MNKINSTDINLSEKKDNYIEIDDFIGLKIIKNINFLEDINIIEGKNELRNIINTAYSFVTFENCLFKNFRISKCTDKFKFINCTFDNINLFSRFENIDFEDCKIAKLMIKNDMISDINKSIIINGGKIDKFLIKNSEISNHVHINHEPNKNLEIDYLEIIDSTFEKDFSFNNTIIKNTEIKNCDFNSLSEFINVQFTEKFNFDEITYKGFTLFDDCIFNAKAEFKYVIFEKFTSFRGSKFNKGINLEYTSSDEEINFYGMEILDKTTTSQETYRIIKNQFEKLNNKIEANKYHTLEMEQHRRNIWERIFNDCNSFLKLLPDGIVLFIHKLSSNHSNNWFLALFWIFIVSFVTSWSLDSVTVDNVFKYINILSKIEDFNCSYIAMTLNKVSLGYLYYQFLTAVRKDTRK